MNNQEKQPLVSVLMPTYNNENHIEASIWSVLNQDFTDFEFIIVNDGSTDQTQSIIEKIQKQDERIKLFNQENQGIVASLNRGLKLASGKYIARIDGDDQWLPHKLKTQVELMQNDPELVLISGGLQTFDMQDRPLGFEFSAHLDEDIRRAMTITNPLVHSSVLFNKEIALKRGGYPDVCPVEDFAFFSKLLNDGKFQIIPYPTIRYRSNPKGLSQSNSSEQNELANKIALENWEKFPPRVLSRKEIKQKTNELLKASITPDFGVCLKHYFLFINTRIGYRMVKKGRLFDGIRQLLNVASTGRTGLKIVISVGKQSVQ